MGMSRRAWLQGAGAVAATGSTLAPFAALTQQTSVKPLIIDCGQLPKSRGVRPNSCLGELERCVKFYGFVAVNLNPDPSGGYWRDPPLFDRWWYPLYEKLVELDVPAMVH